MIWDDAAADDQWNGFAADAAAHGAAHRPAPTPSLADRAGSVLQTMAGGGLAAFDASPPGAPGTVARIITDNALPAAHEAAQPGFLDRTRGNFAAQVRSGVETMPLMGRSFTLADQIEPVLEAVNRGRPLWEQLPNPYRLGEVASYGRLQLDPFGTVAGLAGNAVGHMIGGGDDDLMRDSIEDRIWARVAEGRARDPGAFGNLPKDHADLLDLADYEQRAAQDYGDQLARSAGGPIGGTLVPFAGQAVGQQADPENILALGLGADAPVNVLALRMGVPASESLVRTFVTEGAVNAAMTGVVLPFQMHNAAALGRPMSGADAAEEVGGAALLGGVLGTAGHGLARLLEHARAIPDPPPSVRAAIAHLEGEAAVRATSPDGPSDGAVAAHRANLATAMAQVEDGVPVDVETRGAPAFELSPRADDIARAREDIAAAQEPAGPAGSTLLQAIADNGGIRAADAEGRDAAHLLRDYKGAIGPGRPAKNRLIRPDGLPIDRMRATLQEQGWFGAFEDQTRFAAGARPGDNITDLHDLIDRAGAGEPVPHPDHAFDAQRDFQRAMAEETGRAGINHTHTPEQAAELLARHRLATASTQDRALRYWRERASAQGVEIPDHFDAEDAMVAVHEHDAASAERQGGDAEFAAIAEQALRDQHARLYPEVSHDELERDFRSQAERTLPGAPEGGGGEPGTFEQDPRFAGEDGAGAGTGGRGAPARSGQSLSHFSDLNDEAFREQSRDLARELLPEDHAPAPPGAEPSPFGAAADEIAALRALPQDADIPAGWLFGNDPDSTSAISIKDARLEIERHARAVERLRGCIEGEG